MPQRHQLNISCRTHCRILIEIAYIALLIECFYPTTVFTDRYVRFNRNYERFKVALRLNFKEPSQAGIAQMISAHTVLHA